MVEKKKIPKDVSERACDKYRNFSVPFDSEVTIKRDAYIDGIMDKINLNKYNFEELEKKFYLTHDEDEKYTELFTWIKYQLNKL